MKRSRTSSSSSSIVATTDLRAVTGGGGYGSFSSSLESRDRLGNFEIQRLMSAYNQAETLASSVQKKLDDASSGMINKI